MFAIDHAATSLLIKRRYPTVPLTPLLVSVQVMELAWVALNYLGIERTTTRDSVRSVADISLAYMPFSHSVATAVAMSVVAWLLIEYGLRRPLIGRAVGLGIISHLVLDLATHGPDIALSPGWPVPKLGVGLYTAAPLAAFALELAYGVTCWLAYPAGRGLLAIIVLGNVANLSFFSAGIPGPEQYLAHHPTLVVTVVLVQIVTTLALVGVFARTAHTTK